MEKRNNVTEFVLLGLTQSNQGQKILFVLFLLIYIVTMVGNLLIVLTVVFSPTLDAPMYLLLGYLSFLDAVYATTVNPNTFIDLLYEKKTISFQACMIQLFTEHFFGGSKAIVLTVMAYDRYMAICKPLHYTTITRQGICQLLVVVAWIGGILLANVQILFMDDMIFCGSNVIDHFRCDFFSLLKLAFSDTYMLGMWGHCTVSFLLLHVSYVFILCSLTNCSTEGRRKALSTCPSHIIVIVFFFVLCINMYVHPLTVLPVEKMVAVFYTIVTPLLNPLIYTLRNAEVKQ
ncbi:unnamed protein product, partial [Rangifer tarandus platyrhynchus]